MSVRSTVTTQFEQVAREQSRKLARLSDELKLLDSGLDSLSFALIGVARHYRAEPPWTAMTAIWIVTVLLVPVIFSIVHGREQTSSESEPVAGIPHVA